MTLNGWFCIFNLCKCKFQVFLKVYFLITLGIFMLCSKNGILILQHCAFIRSRDHLDSQSGNAHSCFVQKVPLLVQYSKVETMEKNRPQHVEFLLKEACTKIGGSWEWEVLFPIDVKVKTSFYLPNFPPLPSLERKNTFHLA